MNGKDLTALYYSELEKRHYRPMKAWGRDGKWAKKFLESGRTEEDFMKLLNKALVGPKEIQVAACLGLHRFLYLLPKIELLGEAPWEPSIEERAANVKLIETAVVEVVNACKPKYEKKWEKKTGGGWMRVPQ